MIKPAFLLFLCILSSMVLHAQTALTGADSARMVIDSTLHYARQNALAGNKVNWAAITDSVKSRGENAKNIEEAMPALQVLFKMLGDFHGGAYYKGKNYKWVANRPHVDYKLYTDILTRIRSGSVQISSKIVENGYGYLVIPANNPTKPGESDSIARQIQLSLTNLKPAKLNGLIIDLRTNTGGDMYPMITGVGNLFTAGKLGAFIYPGNKPEDEWHIAGNAFFMSGKQAMSIPSYSKVNPKIKIVLLTSPFTASSAEALLISFKGQKNVRIIGEVTGGYTTANDSFSYLGVQVLMATSVEADRNGVIYYENIVPDELIVTGDNLDDLSTDKKVQAALKWLKGK
ncbi:hypothetical protein DYU05_01675 [Mucilaginibacter terrenus]|uniref:Tail specific protease domain-containing protein n=1 Tax=Mucilaginibacter terrenus TaxID=2482727 RepID=A0A3E2NTL7_9SPHI|nr:S41 family peptidase [Mucilaginibacter terrenus]RFZ84362.1 hypothetical protein DYU05_01675 [Mucilaginibacter terrenus]